MRINKTSVSTLSFVIVGGLLLAGCSTTSTQSKRSSNDYRSSSSGRGAGGSREEVDEKLYVSSQRRLFVNSLSNNPLTSGAVNSRAADKVYNQLPNNGKSKAELESKLAAARLARKPTSTALEIGQRLATLELKRSAQGKVDEEARLDLALVAIQNKNYALAEYFLAQLTTSKNAKIRAAAYNAIGVVALGDDKIPEAVLAFREALKAVNNYKPALLNYGLIALKGGDIATAKKALAGVQDDWYAQVAMISIARIEGDHGRVSGLCDRVLKRHPNHKAALFNCGLFALQIEKNFAKAKALFAKSASAKGGERGWDRLAMQMQSKAALAEVDARKDARPKKRPAGGRGAETMPASDQPTGPSGPSESPGSSGSSERAGESPNGQPNPQGRSGQ